MTKIPLTRSRVQHALDALRRDLGRVVEQADRRLAGPRLDTAKAVLVEQAVNGVLTIKGIDPDNVQVGQGPVQASARRPVARPDPALSKDRQREFIPVEPPEDWETSTGIGGIQGAYIMKPGGCVVLVGRNEKHGWHLHLSHASRFPTLAEVHDAQQRLVPGQAMLAMMFYPTGWQIAYPENRLSLFEITPEDPFARCE